MLVDGARFATDKAAARAAGYQGGIMDSGSEGTPAIHSFRTQ
jgi:hypothetical protein